jgi:hypothetical protein
MHVVRPTHAQPRLSTVPTAFLAHHLLIPSNMTCSAGSYDSSRAFLSVFLKGLRFPSGSVQAQRSLADVGPNARNRSVNLAYMKHES